MKKKLVDLTLFLLAAVLINGCATIFTGSTQRIKFSSEPSGATILINGIEKGITPMDLSLSKPGFSNTTVTFRREGFKDQTFVLDKHFNGISLLNLTLILPWVVDLATGSFMNYDQEGVNIKMIRDKAKKKISQQLNVDQVLFSDELTMHGDDRHIIENKLNKVAIVDLNNHQIIVAN